MICPITLPLNVWTKDEIHGDAIAIRDTTGEIEYLVCDSSMPAPVWVRDADIVSHSTMGGAMKPPEPPQPEPEPQPEAVVEPQLQELSSEDLSQLSNEELGQRMAELRKLAGLDNADEA